LAEPEFFKLTFLIDQGCSAFPMYYVLQVPAMDTWIWGLVLVW